MTVFFAALFLAVISVTIITAVLDGLNNRNTHGDQALVGTTMNLGISIIIVAIGFYFIGFKAAGTWLTNLF